MSCYVCKKERGTEKCSRDECDRWVCKKCLGVNAKHGGSIAGGDKWVTCQGRVQYYCSQHLIRKCVDCETISDGCTRCVSKKTRGAFRIPERCTVCKIPFAKCGECYGKSEKVVLDGKIKRCYDCKEYFCHESCGDEDYIGMYEIEDGLVPKCGRCLFWVD